jgi:putative LysE/RhtB family amino acid efflux pump
MVILASGVALARRALGPSALRAVDALSGVGLLGFGGLLAWRTLHD